MSYGFLEFFSFSDQLFLLKLLVFVEIIEFFGLHIHEDLHGLTHVVQHFHAVYLVETLPFFVHEVVGEVSDLLGGADLHVEVQVDHCLTQLFFR